MPDLIWIQTIWLSDHIPENIKLDLIMLRRYSLAGMWFYTADSWGYWQPQLRL